MNRREFLKTSAILGMGLGLGFSMLPGTAKKVLGMEAGSETIPDLVAVKGGEAAAMFEEGIKAYGGMGYFVKKGQTVLVKPNIGWAVKPEYGANTNPALVKKVIEECYSTGASKVFVFDNSCDSWKPSYSMSGIADAAREAGATVIGIKESDFEEVKIPGAKVLKTTRIHRQVIESDVFINIPVLKSHQATDVTIAMKNLMGIVWDRQWYHNHGLNDCITDICYYRKPDLNIVDAYRVMLKYGPRGLHGWEVTEAKTQLLSTDILAVDAAATKVFGLEPENIRHLKIAAEKKLGEIDLSRLKIRKITL